MTTVTTVVDTPTVVVNLPKEFWFTYNGWCGPNRDFRGTTMVEQIVIQPGDREVLAVGHACPGDSTVPNPRIGRNTDIPLVNLPAPVRDHLLMALIDAIS